MTPTREATAEAESNGQPPSTGSDRPIIGSWIVWLTTAGVILLAVGIASVPRPTLWNDEMLRIAFQQVDDHPLAPGEVFSFALPEGNSWLADDGRAVAIAAPSGEKMIYLRTHVGYGGVERGLLFARTPIDQLIPIDRDNEPPTFDVAGLGPFRLSRPLRPNWLLVERQRPAENSPESPGHLDPKASPSPTTADSP